jgi:hypothetical protein
MEIIEEQRTGRQWFDPRTALVVYIRLLAVVFLASGLRRWAILLGPLAPGGDFYSQPTEWMVAIGFFAIFELVAAVGLWLLASWGTIVWLIAAGTECALHSIFSETFGLDVFILVFHGISVLLFAGLSFYYEKTRDK